LPEWECVDEHRISSLPSVADSDWPPVRGVSIVFDFASNIAIGSPDLGSLLVGKRLALLLTERNGTLIRKEPSSPGQRRICPQQDLFVLNLWSPLRVGELGNVHFYDGKLLRLQIKRMLAQPNRPVMSSGNI
jgi:hypothetical protein